MQPFYSLRVCGFIYLWFMSETCYIRFSIERITNVIGVLTLLSFPWAKSVAVNFIWRFARSTILYVHVQVYQWGVSDPYQQQNSFDTKMYIQWRQPQQPSFIASHNIGKMVMNLCLLKWIVTVQDLCLGICILVHCTRAMCNTFPFYTSLMPL